MDRGRGQHRGGGGGRGNQGGSSREQSHGSRDGSGYQGHSYRGQQFDSGRGGSGNQGHQSDRGRGGSGNRGHQSDGGRGGSGNRGHQYDTWKEGSGNRAQPQRQHSDRGQGGYGNQGHQSSQGRGGYQGGGRGGGQFDNRSGSRGRGGFSQGPPARQLVAPQEALIVPKDPITGTKGKEIILETNYLPLKLGNLNTLRVFHYDVTIEPDRFKKLWPQVMEQFRKINYPNIYAAFDGAKNLMSPKKFDAEYHGEVKLIDRISPDSKPFEFKIKLKFSREVDLSVLKDYRTSSSAHVNREICQFLSMILRGVPLLKCVAVGRNFYTAPKEPIELAMGMEMFYGFHQAPFLAQRGPLVNINVVHKAFPMAKNLVDLIVDICKLREKPTYLRSFEMDKVLEIIKGKKVDYTMNGRTVAYTVNGFVQSAKKEIIQETKATIQEYFAKDKNYTIKNPDLQLLWVGSTKNTIRIPIELCTMRRGQVIKRSASESAAVISKMIRQTATSTTVRKDKIIEQIAVADYKNSPYLKEFGFSIEEKFELVKGRVLDPPRLHYKQRDITPREGRWDIRNQHLLDAAVIKQWVIINLDYNVKVQKIVQLQTEFQCQAKKMGIIMEEPQRFENLDQSRTIGKDLENILQQKKGNDLFIIIFSEQSNLYAKIKQLAEMTVGCLTQCILGKSLSDRDGGIPLNTISNLLLKINAKLNGTNHTLTQRPLCLKGNVMIMGADVAHPAPQDRETKPSFAAVTASHDLNFFKYNAICQLQPAKKEMLSDLSSIVVKQLEYYSKHTGGKIPDHIIFFRDGIAEGQFEDAVKQELTAIRQACQKWKTIVKKTYNPLITFIVVMKRHHTRFFPVDPKDIYDRKNFNVPAGTIVDTGITHPIELNLKDYYLASHRAIQGVTKPAKYCTLHDDAGLSYDDIEEISYHLCHMYGRCTSSVSYPAPTYYAHLAADKTKKLYEQVKIDWEKLEKEEKILVVTKIQENSPMSFI